MTTIGVTECSRLIHLLSSKFKKMLRRTLRKPSSTEPKTAILSSSLKINKLINELKTLVLKAKEDLNKASRLDQLDFILSKDEGEIK